MEQTENLALPYIMPSQAQKHVTHNEALRILDALVQLAVIDRDRTDPPSGAADGERHIVAAGATGAWTGKDGQVAVMDGGAWTFLAPRPGWRAWVVNEEALVVWDGAAWKAAAGMPSSLQNLELLGLGTQADAVNPFSARLNKALWTAKPAGEGGSGDLRYTLNKDGPGNVLSILFQSAWEGRAELGLVGDDDLTLKVSSDGTTWREAMSVDRASGAVRLPNTNVLTGYALNLYDDSGRFAGAGESATTIGAFAFPDYLTLYNGSTAAALGKFIHDNTTYGGNKGELEPEVKDLIDKIRDPSRRRYGVEFWVAEITMGSGTAQAFSYQGETYYLCLFNRQQIRAPAMTFHAYLRAVDSSVLVVPQASGITIYKDGGAGVTAPDRVVINPSDGWVSVTIQDEQNPYTSLGYGPPPFTLCAQNAGDHTLIACPALMGGIVDIDDNIGVIAGYNSWAS